MQTNHTAAPVPTPVSTPVSTPLSTPVPTPLSTPLSYQFLQNTTLLVRNFAMFWHKTHASNHRFHVQC